MSRDIASAERGDAAAEKAKNSKRLNKARRAQFQPGTSCGVSLLAFHAGVTGHHALHVKETHLAFLAMWRIFLEPVDALVRFISHDDKQGGRPLLLQMVSASSPWTDASERMCRMLCSATSPLLSALRAWGQKFGDCAQWFVLCLKSISFHKQCGVRGKTLQAEEAAGLDTATYWHDRHSPWPLAGGGTAAHRGGPAASRRWVHVSACAVWAWNLRRGISEPANGRSMPTKPT